MDQAKQANMFAQFCALHTFEAMSDRIPCAVEIRTVGDTILFDIQDDLVIPITRKGHGELVLYENETGGQAHPIANLLHGPQALVPGCTFTVTIHRRNNAQP